MLFFLSPHYVRVNSFLSTTFTSFCFRFIMAAEKFQFVDLSLPSFPTAEKLEFIGYVFFFLSSKHFSDTHFQV